MEAVMGQIIDTVRKARRLCRTLAGQDLWYRPQVRCARESLGVPNPVYFVEPTRLNSESIVYSVGVGDNIDFDLALITRFGMQIHAFDPTPRSLEWLQSQDLPDQFHFHPWGLADFDGSAVFHPPANAKFVSYTLMDQDSSEGDTSAPVKRLQTTMEALGHDGLDLLKMDIEGAEYGVIDDLLQSGIQVQQLLIEFHHRCAGVGTSKTRNAITALNRSGFKIFYVSPTGMEYSFLNCGR